MTRTLDVQKDDVINFRRDGATLATGTVQWVIPDLQLAVVTVDDPEIGNLTFAHFEDVICLAEPRRSLVVDHSRAKD